MRLVDYDDGTTFCALRNIRGIAFKITGCSTEDLRYNLKEFFKKQEKTLKNSQNRSETCIDKACIYLKLGRFQKDGKQIACVEAKDLTAYLGMSIDVRRRFSTHLSPQKQQESAMAWDTIIIFCRTDYDFNYGHVFYIEQKLIYEELQEAKITFTNLMGNRKSTDENVPKTAKNKKEKRISAREIISNDDKGVCDDFIKSIKILAKHLAGFDVFESSLHFDTEETSVPTNTHESPLFYLVAEEQKGQSKHYATGKLVIDAEKIKFRVHKGSKFRTPTKGFAQRYRPYKNIRKKLQKDGNVDETGTFVRDILFDSPSTAACVIYGSVQNGNIRWRIPLGQYDDITSCKDWKTLGTWKLEQKSENN